MKRALALGTLAILACGKSEETSGGSAPETWERVYELSGDQEPRALAVDSRGNIWVVGAADSSFWLAEVSSDGELLWDTSWGQGALLDIAADEKGYLAVGYVKEGSYEGIYLVKWASEGRLDWDTVITWAYSEQATGVVSVPGGYLISGYTNSFSGGRAEPFLLKLSDDGSVEWFKRFGGDYVIEWAYGIIPFGSSYLLYGARMDTSYQRDAFWLLVNAEGDSLGAWVWGEEDDEELLGGNGAYLVGYKRQEAQEDGLVLELGSNGELSSYFTTSLSGSDTLWGIAEGLAVGVCKGDFLFWDIGSQPETEGDLASYESAKGIAAHPDGSLIVVGVVNSGGGKDLWVSKR